MSTTFPPGATAPPPSPGATTPPPPARTQRRVRKPQLRGLLHRYMRFHGIMAAILATIAAGTCKFCIADARRQRYIEFYRDYDAEKAFEEMRKKNVFTSAPWPPKMD